jgi:hypothetical protein
VQISWSSTHDPSLVLSRDAFRTQIFIASVARRTKHVVGCIVSVIPPLSGDRINPERERTSTKRENERTGGRLPEMRISRLTGPQWANGSSRAKQRLANGPASRLRVILEFPPPMERPWAGARWVSPRLKTDQSDFNRMSSRVPNLSGRSLAPVSSSPAVESPSRPLPFRPEGFHCRWGPKVPWGDCTKFGRDDIESHHESRRFDRKKRPVLRRQNFFAMVICTLSM